MGLKSPSSDDGDDSQESIEDDSSSRSSSISSSGEDDVDAKELAKRGFLEGGKVDTFSRAFNRLVDQANESRMTAPILAGSKSIHKIQEEEKRDLEQSKAVKQLKEEMKQRGHYIPLRKGMDPDKDAREKRLQKTATKGVVQLFNAINAAQKRIRNEETKGNKGKIARLGKAGFLAEIKHMKEREGPQPGLRKEGNAHDDDHQDAGNTGNHVGWDVLKEGFVGINQNSVKMKDWDKQQQDTSDDNAESAESSDSEGF